MPVNRMDRINAYLQELLTVAIRKVKDPRLSQMLTVNEVRTAKDLSMAKVYVSCDCGHKEREDNLAALTHARGFLKREITPLLATKSIPDFVFVWDATIETGTRIGLIIESLSRERDGSCERREPETPSDPASAVTPDS